MSARNEAARKPANLILIEQSGAKREIPQDSPDRGMLEAQEAMQRPGLRLPPAASP